MGLHLMDVYRSPNIGVFLKVSDRVLLVPKGLAPSKSEKLSKALEVDVFEASVGGSRLLGPLMSMNGNGALVSRLAEQGEMKEIAAATGGRVAALQSRFTSTGNLIVSNDKRSLVSPLLEQAAVAQVRDTLGTEVERMAIHEYSLVGAMVVATNSGAAVYPGLSDAEVDRISDFLGVQAFPTSVNKGVPFVASGLIANGRCAVAGNQTTGPELVFITRALSV